MNKLLVRLNQTYPTEAKDCNRVLAWSSDVLINAVPTPIQYCRKITLQPEELLVYSLVNVALPPGTNRKWITSLLSPNHSLYIVKLLE